MAKFVFSGSIGFGFGAGSANGKKNWIQKLVTKVAGVDKNNEEKPGQEQTSGEAAAGLGGYGIQYSGSVELSIAEMRELYELTHTNEEFEFGRAAAELKAIGSGIKSLADRFVADNGNTINSVWDVGCSIYEHAKKRDYETSKVDREVRLNEFRDRLEMDREMDRLRKEDARIRAEEAEKEEKAKK